MTKLSYPVLLGLLLAVCGCASSPDTHFYTLDAAAPSSREPE